MTWHLFGTVLTHQGTYANNRGENRGATNTLQKVIRNGGQYTTVSSEAIRYALREGWQAERIDLNRTMPDHRSNVWQDRTFKNWQAYVDDDVLGYMHASEELSRRGIFEINRAISTTPWPGTIHRNFATPGSNPAVNSNDPIPYGIEVHHTRYQFPFALTPEYLGRVGETKKNGKKKTASYKDLLSKDEKIKRVTYLLQGIQNLRRVGGNHARYMTDYSPEAIVLRWTTDPAPRMLYCFEEGEYGEISLKQLVRKLEGGDISATELFIGTNIEIKGIDELESKGVSVKKGVKAAITELLTRIKSIVKPSENNNTGEKKRGKKRSR
jgi:CRISPR-associated protein Cst2